MDIPNNNDQVVDDYEQTILKELHAAEPWIYKHTEATQRYQQQERYRKVVEHCRQAGSEIDNIEFPAAFGPNGELLGAAVARDIEPGERIYSIPCSYRVSKSTIS